MIPQHCGVSALISWEDEVSGIMGSFATNFLMLKIGMKLLRVILRLLVEAMMWSWNQRIHHALLTLVQRLELLPKENVIIV